MTYNHISKEDRRRIEALTQAGSTNRYPRVEPVGIYWLDH